MNDEIVFIKAYIMLTLYSRKWLAFYGTRSIDTDVYCNVHNVATW
jgi:hypothetical protein